MTDATMAAALGKPMDGIKSGKETETSSERQGTFVSGKKWKPVIYWANVFKFSIFHLMAVYAVFFEIQKCKWITLVWAYALYLFGMIGVTAGTHRLWAHKSYKATFPLRLILVFLQTLAFQNDVIDWVRDHRVHHRHSETDADPHNAKRGFFFSHIGWVMQKKHPEVIEKGKEIDFSDLYSDPLLVFQRKYYKTLVVLVCFVMPSVVPWSMWGESLWTAYMVAGVLRYCICLNFTFLVNSAAHLWGTRPYDKKSNPAENFLVSLVTTGEGWHNYHHAFPQDYSAAEMKIPGISFAFNASTIFIDAMASIGWAFDRKSPSADIVERRKQRCGDGTTIGDSFRPTAWESREGEKEQEGVQKEVKVGEEKKEKEIKTE